MKDMDFEIKLRAIASGMEYPPTPDMSGSVAAQLRGSRTSSTSRTYARLLIVVVVLLASLLIIPPVRASVLEFLQVGVVRIFRSEPIPAPPPAQFPLTVAPGTATLVPTATLPSLLPLLEDMAGEVTLQEAQQTASYSILLPTYPAGIGEPDRVFVQDMDGPMTILVWLDPQQPGQVRMSLHFIPEDSWAVNKFAPITIDETSVNGHQAAWAVGPYPVLLRNGDLQIRGLVNGHALIWVQDGVTYRLETNASMEEAVRIAESLRAIP